MEGFVRKSESIPPELIESRFDAGPLCLDDRWQSKLKTNKVNKLKSVAATVIIFLEDNRSDVQMVSTGGF